MKMGHTVELLKLRAREALDDMGAQLVRAKRPPAPRPARLLADARSPRRPRPARLRVPATCEPGLLNRDSAQEMRLADSDQLMIDPLSLNDYPITGQKVVKVKVTPQ